MAVEGPRGASHPEQSGGGSSDSRTVVLGGPWSCAEWLHSSGILGGGGEPTVGQKATAMAGWWLLIEFSGWERVVRTGSEGGFSLG